MSTTHPHNERSVMKVRCTIDTPQFKRFVLTPPPIISNRFKVEFVDIELEEIIEVRLNGHRIDRFGFETSEDYLDRFYTFDGDDIVGLTRASVPDIERELIELAVG